MKLLLPLMTLVGVAILSLPDVKGQNSCQCQCPGGWVRFNSDCYQFFPTRITWQAAQSACEAMGANLISIHSEAENTFAYGLIDTDGCNPAAGENGFAWIGYHQPSGPFVWSDGSSIGYENWAPNQPDNYNHNGITEDCGHLRGDPAGSWNDFKCDKQIGFICKKPLA